jgi:IS1 family transposase/transposase-like protein
MRTPNDWGQPCPNPECSQYTLLNRGNVKALSTYRTQSGKRRIFQCTRCETSFAETRDTVFFDLRTLEEKVMRALKMLLVKVALAGISFVLGVTAETTLEWLRRAGQQAEAINASLLRELPVTQVPLDEMWTCVSRNHAKAAEGDGESPDTSADGRQWIWLSYAPEWRLRLATVVGPRTAHSALTLIQLTAAMIVGVPCFFSDGFSSYWAALLATYHQVKPVARTGKPGRPRQPILEPHPDLVYGQVIKQKVKGWLQAVNYRIVCGGPRFVLQRLALSTSLLERLNLTLRQHLAPLGRKSLGFCKEREQLRRRVVFFPAFYNFARPHQSLRLPLAVPASYPTGLICPKWQPRTPGMAADLTDHVWTFRELLTVKFELPHSQSISG